MLDELRPEWDRLVHLPPGVVERLEYYVYLYIDPRDGHPFYVGKGKGERILYHFEDDQDSKKTRMIAELQKVGLQPRLEILAHGLKDEQTAFRIEAAAIDLLGLDYLTNRVRGSDSLEYGRMSLDELIGYYAAPPVAVTDPALLIRVNQLYRHTMTPLELYEITRGIWRLGDRREKAKYAFAVFEGVVREVYSVANWHRAFTTPYQTRDLSKRNLDGRWEFEGTVAPEDIREKYHLHSVRAYFRRGNQSPTVYVNI